MPKTPSSNWLGLPLAILPSALDSIEELLAAGPGAVGVRAATQTLSSGSPGVRVITLEGPVMTGLPDWLKEYVKAVDPVQVAADVRAAAQDPDVTGIVLVINSPGGTVTGVDDAATAVREANAVKPVVVYAPDLMASAAYWIGCGARAILTSSTGLIGSIGTYLRWTDYSGQAQQQGMAVHVYRSAPGKAPGQPGEAKNAHLDEALTSMVDATNAVFVQGVADGRGLPLAQAQERLATGHIWVGAGAVAVGVADQIGSFADAVRLAGGTPQASRSTRPAALSPARAETLTGGTMPPEVLAMLGLGAEATPEQIQAAIREQRVNAAATERAGMLALLGLTEEPGKPADLANLAAQASDGVIYREAQLDRLHALTITVEGNDEAGIKAADDARAVYSAQTLERISAQITRLEAKRDTLPGGSLVKHGDKTTAPKPLNLSVYGLPGRR